MRQIAGISKNTFLQTVRQPVYGLIILFSLGGIAITPAITAWTLDDDNKLLRDIGLSTLLIQGLFLAAFAAATVLDVEIHEKTMLTVAAKPVGRAGFILGKYLGVMGALLAAHYLASIAFFMAMRHGVLQSAAEEPDMTVIVFGPILFAAVLIVAALLNYLYDYRFLPSVVALALPSLTASGAILLVIDRNWQIKSYEITQELIGLPKEVCDRLDGDRLGDVITLRPQPGERLVPGAKVWLVRSTWKGQIGEAEQNWLLGLSESKKWVREVNFLVQECRKIQDLEIVKAVLLIATAVFVLGGLALAAATRLGMMATCMLCLLALAVGLSSDQVIKPLADGGAAWARLAYRLVPNFQFFWMVDALSDEIVIPWSYLAQAAGYGLLYAAALVLVAMSLFETREVG